MATTSPPKPWERAGAGATAARASGALAPSMPAPSTVAATSNVAPASSTVASSSSQPPIIPERPSSLTSVANRNASTYSNTMNRPYGSSPYGMGASPYSYSSPYSRFGGGMGGMGGMYGGGMYGGGMYGGGMYGGGYGGGYGMPGDPNDPNNSLTHNFQQSTQATFQIIESIVGAFGGFATMLESTYMATHSSFFAMVSVAEQFGNLRQTLGSVLGIYAVLRWLRTLVAKLTGRPPPADATSLTPAAFAAFTSGGAAANIGPDGRPVPRPSKKPFIVFLLAVFGLPYLMGKLIRALAKNQADMQAQQQQQGGQADRPFDASKLDFCQVRYDFPPADAVANGSFDQGMDLQVKAGDFVAVLDKTAPDSNGAESQWWRCRARDGRVGYLPAVYLQTIERRPQPAQIAAAAANSSRANTMPGSIAVPAVQGPQLMPPASVTGKANTMTGATVAGSRSSSMVGKGKNPGDLENMQRAWANDR